MSGRNASVAQYGPTPTVTPTVGPPQHLAREPLPHTGFDAIPLLLGGAVLLAVGLAWRRRSGRA